MQTQEQIPFVELKIARFPRVCQTISERILNKRCMALQQKRTTADPGATKREGLGKGIYSPPTPPPDFSYNVVFGLIKYFIQAEIYTTRTYTKTYSPPLSNVLGGPWTVSTWILFTDEMESDFIQKTANMCS